MLIHNLIGYFLVSNIILFIILSVIITIDMHFGQPLYIKMYKKYHKLVERL